MTINGVLAGLVAVTAGCNVFTPGSALIVGLIAGTLVDLAVIFIDNININDPVGAIAVHEVNGLFGTIAVGLFTSEDGLFFGGGADLLVTQIIAYLLLALFLLLLHIL